MRYILIAILLTGCSFTPEQELTYVADYCNYRGGIDHTSTYYSADTLVCKNGDTVDIFNAETKIDGKYYF